MCGKAQVMPKQVENAFADVLGGCMPGEKGKLLIQNLQKTK